MYIFEDYVHICYVNPYRASMSSINKNGYFTIKLDHKDEYTFNIHLDDYMLLDIIRNQFMVAINTIKNIAIEEDTPCIWYEHPYVHFFSIKIHGDKFYRFQLPSIIHSYNTMKVTLNYDNKQSWFIVNNYKYLGNIDEELEETIKEVNRNMTFMSICTLL